jgi:hypothetical protein
MTKAEVEEALIASTKLGNIMYSPNDYRLELDRRDTAKSATRTSWSALASAIASAISAAIAIAAVLLGHHSDSQPASPVTPPASSVAPSSVAPSSVAPSSVAPSSSPHPMKPARGGGQRVPLRDF